MVTTNDPAGTGIQLARAIERFSSHRCRLVSTETRYRCGFEKDLHVPDLRDYGELEAVLKGADLFHFHMVADEDLALGPFRVRDFHRGQPLVHHHHGEPPFRADPGRFVERERALGRTALVSTPDLLRLHPDATWVPNPVPVGDPDYRPAAPERDEKEIRVGHSPTRRELKNTAEFLAVMEELRTRDPRLRAEVIENQPHRECLRQKRSCQIFFDHMQGYFGVSSLEALSQGVSTIAGIDDWNREAIARFTGTDELPWVVARDASELVRRIQELAGDPARRRKIGAASRAWMERAWSAPRIVEILLDAYAGAEFGGLA